MKILFIGDIYGRGGRATVKKVLPGIIEEYKPDLVLANPENLSHGSGFSKNNIDEMKDAGINFFTSGNHVWDNSDGVGYLDKDDFPVLRPANYPSDKTPGRGYRVVEDSLGRKVLVISLMGRVFMKADLDCPFRKADEILEEFKDENLAAIFVDFHAETTAEKAAFAHYLDGRVSAVVGTHTHVQTNDLHILSSGSAFITDVGMTGPLDSVIGVKKEIIIERFLTQLPVKFQPQNDGKMAFCAVFVDIDEESKKALNVKNIFQIT